MVTQENIWVHCPSGEEVQIYHLETNQGARSVAEVLQVWVINSCLKLCECRTETAAYRTFVLGYDDLAGYEVNGCFFGATNRKKKRKTALHSPRLHT